VLLTLAVYWFVTEGQVTSSQLKALPKESQQLPKQNEPVQSKLLSDSAAAIKQEPAKKSHHVEKSDRNSRSKKMPKEEPTRTETQKDVFTEAEPIEGFAKLYNYFNANLKYPSSHLKEGIEGMEIISLTIDEDGKAIDYKVVQSLGADYDEEATRLLNSMPKWKPATLNGRPVASKISVPFTFTINKK
jgi:TonB family protein